VSAPRTAERLVTFTDAVVAIAITLLILPLADVASEALGKHEQSFQVIGDNRWEIYSFVLSFAVIARQWYSHHKIFEHINSYSGSLIWWNFAWLLTIVALPFPTEMIGGFGDDRFVASLYIGSVLANTVCQVALILIVNQHPDIVRDDDPIPRKSLFATATSAVLLFVALMLAIFVPGVRYWGLLVLLVPDLIQRARQIRALVPHRKDDTGQPDTVEDRRSSGP
jgi:uncharacterized membrane protein